MCLVVIAYRACPDYPLIVAANRDEFHARPTEDAHWWADRPDVLGGRDLQAGGTWLAVQRNGRFATVTNYRDAELPSGKFLSRGHLITDFLDSELTAIEYLQTIQGDRYSGFNLLVADGETLGYLSNRGAACKSLSPGIYAVANESLDTPWPKVVRSKSALQRLVDANTVNETELFRILNDRNKARSNEVNAHGLPFEKAHALTAPFIVLPDYGTRCSTVLMRDHSGRHRFVEKRFTADGMSSGSSEFSFDAAPTGPRKSTATKR